MHLCITQVEVQPTYQPESEAGRQLVCMAAAQRNHMPAARHCAHAAMAMHLHRRRGGIEPLCISASLELKCSPSTNLTHPGSTSHVIERKP